MSVFVMYTDQNVLGRSNYD